MNGFSCFQLMKLNLSQLWKQSRWLKGKISGGMTTEECFLARISHKGRNFQVALSYWRGEGDGPPRSEEARGSKY